MAIPAEELKARLAGQRWTAYNIRLTPEITTMPGTPDFMETHLHWLAIRRLLRALYGGSLEGLRVADLGCLEGGFSLALAQMGAEVVGVEARTQNIDKCRLLEEHFALPNLRFAQADVKEFDVSSFGTFDVVLALGILYHLEDPVGWLRQVAGATRSVLYVDTHFAPVDDSALERLEPGLRSLGGLERRSDGGWEYTGRWFHEYDTEAQRDEMLWASWSNPDSFWLTRKSLIELLIRCGFDSVLEQHEHAVHWMERFATSFPRLLCVGLRSQAIAEHRRPSR
jgi:SAM-dependent methyltransferase